jgi:hypothetical protein
MKPSTAGRSRRSADMIRKNTPALARLDELQETFYARALDGDVECAAFAPRSSGGVA